MDDIALAILWREMKKDCAAAKEAGGASHAAYAESGVSRLAGSSHYIARFYNVIEQMGLRVAKAFENNIDDDKGWHTELVRRMTLDFPGIRPALFDTGTARALQNLRGFRHIVTHAYDLEFDPAQVSLQLGYLDSVLRALPQLARQFIDSVAAMHGLTPPPE